VIARSTSPVGSGIKVRRARGGVQGSARRPWRTRPRQERGRDHQQPSAEQSQAAAAYSLSLSPENAMVLGPRLTPEQMSILAWHQFLRVECGRALLLKRIRAFEAAARGAGSFAARGAELESLAAAISRMGISGRTARSRNVRAQGQSVR